MNRTLLVFAKLMLYVIVLGGLAWAGYHWRQQWLPLVVKQPAVVDEHDDHADMPSAESPKIAKLSRQAQANLGLEVKPVQVGDYWKKIQIPGVIVERPGVTDKGVISPLAGVVTKVHAFAGDIVKPGQKLFTIKLVSTYLQQLQSDLFKATTEISLINKEVNRLSGLADSGSIPGKKLVELRQELSRQQALIAANRQELLARGLSQQQVQQIENGQFLTSIEVNVPEAGSSNYDQNAPDNADANGDLLEVQSMHVSLGQQIEAGQSLVTLADHSSLYIKGHAFKSEASDLANAAEFEWPVQIEFNEDESRDWPKLDQTFHIRHLANTTDPNSRTFDFFVPLVNQSRVYEKNNRTMVFWRFRPGQRVNILVPIEKMTAVIVLPAEAVAFEGPEAYVFQQNGDLFNRIPVQVLHQDRTQVVIQDDGSLPFGFYLAQNSAAALNRVLKAQSSSGMRNDVHVHADGTVHAAH